MSLRIKQNAISFMKCKKISKMLNEQLQKQIEQEAVHEASLHFHPQYSPDQNTACRINYKNGASKYASLWQAAEEKAARYEKALKNFARQIKMHCNKMGIRSVVIQCIANRMEELDITEAITPKTSEDEK